MRTSTNVFARGLTIAAIGGAALANLSGGTILQLSQQATIASKFAEVNGLRLHYLVGWQRAIRSSSFMATRRTVTCGGR